MTSVSQDQLGLFSPQIFSNPYPIYEAIRSHDPVSRDESLGSYVLTRYADVATVLRDPRFSADRLGSEEGIVAAGLSDLLPLFSSAGKMMLFRDPPSHTRLRGLVNKAFTPRVVEGMRSRVEQLVAELLDAVLDKGSMDIISDLAVPLPTVVIAVMLGVPPEDRERLKKWSDDFGIFIGSFDAQLDEMLSVQASVLEFAEYFRGHVHDLRKHPKNDLLSALATAEERGDMLTEDELLANCVLMLAAGHETTTNLIGNGMLALLLNPEQREKLAAHPELIGSAVEELLRYDSPVQITGRTAKETVEMGGKTIEAGEGTTVILGAANRDPERFANPHTLDITRLDNRHLAFGYASHFCVGAPLARLEGQVAINALLERMPAMWLASEPEKLEWQHNHVLHGLKSLPVEF